MDNILEYSGLPFQQTGRHLNLELAAVDLKNHTNLWERAIYERFETGVLGKTQGLVRAARLILIARPGQSRLLMQLGARWEADALIWLNMDEKLDLIFLPEKERILLERDILLLTWGM